MGNERKKDVERKEKELQSVDVENFLPLAESQYTGSY